MVRLKPKLLLLLTMITNRQAYNCFHSDQGHRYPLDPADPDAQALYAMPFAAKIIGY
jgi:hypothetical protein